MGKFFKKLTFRILVVLNIFSIILLLFVGYSGIVNPAKHPVWATIGMWFPLMLIVNIAFLVLWVFIKKKVLWLPILGLFLAYFPIRAYIPFNLPKDKPHGTIKILSYNVFLFDTWDDVSGQINPIVKYIVRSKADIVCLQEATLYTPKAAKIMRYLKKSYPYIDNIKKKTGTDDLMLLSKFPILHREIIPYPSKSNMSVAYYININGTKTLLVNNHFESYGLSSNDKADFNNIIKGNVIGRDRINKFVSLVDKIGNTMARRAPQADAVATFVKKHLDKNIPVILCGDFNDNPISYSYYTISKVLNDSYKSSGNGIGWTYNENRMYFRIDHIFASNEFEPYGAKVDKSIKNSDHYPIYCWLKYYPKP